jgi:hypothetical protein
VQEGVVITYYNNNNLINYLSFFIIQPSLLLSNLLLPTRVRGSRVDKSMFTRIQRGKAQAVLFIP